MYGVWACSLCKGSAPPSLCSGSVQLQHIREPDLACCCPSAQAAAEAQQLRELEDKCEALTQQLAATADAQRAAESRLACALCHSP